MIDRKTGLKGQSALEYLSTYMWAILIIAIVLAALYALGVFNGFSFAPREQPGSCVAVRPGGPGTARYISLQGTCNGGLPKFAAQFNGGSVSIHTSKLLSSAGGSFSISIWMEPTGNALSSAGEGVLVSGDQPASYSFDMELCGANPGCDTLGKEGLHAEVGNGRAWLAFPDYPYVFSPDTWYNEIMVVTGTGYAVYLDGANVLSGPLSGTPILLGSNPDLLVGAEYIGAEYFSGDLANLQIYNTSLSQNAVKSLYLEGIGGVPIDLQDLVGWWPLNGNANDYSGNSNNGAANSISYTDSWTNGYSVP